jgi:hypothetical protein
VVDFEEKTKGRTVDLNLLGEHLQGTPNVLATRKLAKRPKEPLLQVVDLPPQEKLNNFEIVIPLQTPENPENPENITQPPDEPANLPESKSDMLERATT